MTTKSLPFHFKEFTLLQNHAAMKVGTDGVMLGAWAPVQHAKKALDVGTGTGLIALMLAQRNTSLEVIGLEIDADACLDASKNFSNSAWSNRVGLIHNSFQNFVAETSRLFDTIVCNPPFFSERNLMNNYQRAIARQNHMLSNNDLLKGAYSLLKENGSLSVIIPFNRFDLFCEEANRNLFYEQKRLLVYPTPTKKAVRVLSTWSKMKIEKTVVDELIIEDRGRHQYSEGYKNLTKSFYLKF